MISFTLLVNCIALLMVCRRFKMEPMSPALMYMYSWTVICFLYFLPILKFEQDLTLLTYLIVTLCQISFVVGAVFAPKPPRDFFNIRKVQQGALASKGWLVLYVALFAVSVAYTVVEIAGPAGSALMSNLAEGIQSVRVSAWDSFFAEAQNSNPLKSMGLSGSYITALLLPIFWKKKDYFLISISLASILVLIANSFLSAGRFTIGVLLLGLAISYQVIYRPYKNPLRLRIVVSGIVVSVFFFIIFPLMRNSNLDGRLDLFLSLTGDVQFSDTVEEISTIYGFYWVKTFVYGISYFPQSLNKLNFFIEHGLDNINLQFGLYNLTFISQFVGALTEQISPWQSVRISIGDIMRQMGWSLNPWASGIRDIAIDFSLIGSIIFCGLFGYMSQRLYHATLTTRNTELYIMGVVLSAGAFIFPFVSWLQIRILSNTFLLILFVMTSKWLFRSGRSNKKAQNLLYSNRSHSKWVN